MYILRLRIDSVDYAQATGQILSWARACDSRYVCLANVHMLMEAFDSPEFAQVVNFADLVTPDGVPVVWMLRAKGQHGQSRVYGPTLMLHVLEWAALQGAPVGFYGGSLEVLDMLVQRMQAKYQSLHVSFACSPPFRDLSPEEDETIIEQMNSSGTKILFVGLGCPLQEIWMSKHRDRVNAVMLGVGAAFDFHAGMKPQAPAWMQMIGLEWLFRLLSEPRRLWKRYLYHNPRFIVLAIADLLGLLKRVT